MLRLSILALLFLGIGSLGIDPALAGHCRKGSNAQRIRCLNSEVSYLTEKWKEARVETRALREDLAALRAEIPKIVATTFPQGTVLSWFMPAGAPMPDGWAACDGTNGQPNLFGKFLRGGTNVGAEGGAEKHAHKVANDGGRDGRGFAVDKSPSALGDADEQSNLPPYVTVAFICKK
jgi:hypothetical protein